MTQKPGNETKQERTREQETTHPEASEHGHTGEGAASAMEQLILQGEKHRRQDGDSGDRVS
jgi:hypothetical protein